MCKTADRLCMQEKDQDVRYMCVCGSPGVLVNVVVASMLRLDTVLRKQVCQVVERIRHGWSVGSSSRRNLVVLL